LELHVVLQGLGEEGVPLCKLALHPCRRLALTQGGGQGSGMLGVLVLLLVPVMLLLLVLVLELLLVLLLLVMVRMRLLLVHLLLHRRWWQVQLLR